MIQRIRNRMTWPIALGVLALQALVSVLLFNTGWVPQIEASGAGLIDTQFAYSLDDIYRILGQYGVDGRALYTNYLLVADFFYGALSGLTFAAFFLMVSKLPLSWARYWAWLVWLPVGMTVLDFVENTLLLLILSTYPEIPVALVSFASLTTTLKLIVVNLVLALILGGLVLTVMVIGQRRRRAA